MATYKLGEKQELFSKLLARLIDEGFRLGYGVRMGECHRTPEQAELNAQSGKGIANSLHTKRLAVDLILFRDGKYLDKSEDYAPLGQFWKAQHPLCFWGGDFTRPDGGHFSITHRGIK